MDYDDRVVLVFPDIVDGKAGHRSYTAVDRKGALALARADGHELFFHAEPYPGAWGLGDPRCQRP